MILLEPVIVERNGKSDVSSLHSPFTFNPLRHDIFNGGFDMQLQSRLLVIACLILLACDDTVPAKAPPFDVRDVQQVRRLVAVGGVGDVMAIRNTEWLLRQGEKAFPAYEAILSDTNSTTDEIFGVICVLNDIEADRRRFIKYVIPRLTDARSGTRHNAVCLLEKIGSTAETSPLIALLSDKHSETVCVTAEVIAAIGGPNDLVAMDVWLRGIAYLDKVDIRVAVKHHRGKLKKRLDEDKDPRKRAQKIQKCWRDLRVTEYHYPGIHRTVWQLTTFGSETVAFLKARVHPVPVETQKHLNQLLADLDSDSFDRREAATRELSRGVVAESVLEMTLANSPSLELRRRLEAILEGLPAWRTKNPELLQQVRSIWVLQQIGTPEAKALLEKIAAGTPSARQTQKAKAALKALNKRGEERSQKPTRTPPP